MVIKLFDWWTPGALKFCRLVVFWWTVLFLIVCIYKHYCLQINISSSMPQRLWFVHVGDKNLTRGDYVVVRFHDYRMQNAADFEYVVKQVVGTSGDELRYMSGNSANTTRSINSHGYILLNQQKYPVYETLSGYHFNRLTGSSMKVPPDCYFLHGQSNPSFDSRYKEVGLICNNQVLGRAYPLL